MQTFAEPPGFAEGNERGGARRSRRAPGGSARRDAGARNAAPDKDFVGARIRAQARTHRGPATNSTARSFRATPITRPFPGTHPRSTERREKRSMNQEIE